MKNYFLMGGSGELCLDGC